MYTDTVSLEIAKKLNEVRFCPKEDILGRYAITECTVVDHEDRGGVIKSGEYFQLPALFSVASGDCIYAPTYAEVFDWAISKGYSIEVMKLQRVWGCDVFELESGTNRVASSEGEWEEAVDLCILTLVQKMLNA